MSSLEVSKAVAYGVVLDVSPPPLNVSKAVAYGVVLDVTPPPLNVSKAVAYGAVLDVTPPRINLTKSTIYSVVSADVSGDLYQTDPNLLPTYRIVSVGDSYLELGEDKKLDVYFPTDYTDTYTFIIRRPGGNFEVFEKEIDPALGKTELPFSGNINQAIGLKGTYPEDFIETMKLSMNSRSPVQPPEEPSLILEGGNFLLLEDNTRLKLE